MDPDNFQKYKPKSAEIILATRIETVENGKWIAKLK
jgi:hypothetical protein